MTVESYLSRLDRALSGLPAVERREILRETRSHLTDRLSKTGADRMAEVLAELGTPEAYAVRFLSDSPDGERSPEPSPVDRLARLATGPRTGLPALLAVAIGYSIALAGLLVAVLKLVYPDRMGGWVVIGEDTRRLTFGLMGSNPEGRELFGYWLVPMGLLVAYAMHRLVALLLRRVAGPPARGGGRAVLALVLILTSYAASGCTAAGIQSRAARPFPQQIQRTAEYRSVNARQQDLQYLTALVEAAYPMALIPGETGGLFRARASETMGALGEPVTRLEHLMRLSWTLAALGSGHTAIQWSAFDHDPERYPVLLAPLDSVRIAAVGASVDPGLVGAVVLEVNGRPVGDVIRAASEWLPADNAHRATGLALAHLQLPSWVRIAGLAGAGASLQLTVRAEGGVARVVEMAPVAAGTESIRPLRAAVSPVSSASRQFDHVVLAEHDLAYMRADFFLDRTAMLAGLGQYVVWWMRPFARLHIRRTMGTAPTMAEALDAAIGAANEAGVGHLVVDLRGNAGGDPRLGRQLLYHLERGPGELDGIGEEVRISGFFRHQFPDRHRRIDSLFSAIHGRPLPADTVVYVAELEAAAGGAARPGFFAEMEDPASPFHIRPDRPVFRGTVIVLVNSGTSSAAMHLAAVMQDNDLAVLVGTPTGEDPEGTSTLSMVRLPNDGATFSVATSRMRRPDRSRAADGAVIPDHVVRWDLEALLAGRDRAVEWVLDRIGTGGPLGLVSIPPGGGFAPRKQATIGRPRGFRLLYGATAVSEVKKDDSRVMLRAAGRL